MQIFGVILGILSVIGIFLGAVLTRLWIVVLAVLMILEIASVISIGWFVLWYPLMMLGVGLLGMLLSVVSLAIAAMLVEA